MGISYGATYGIGVALKEDQFDMYDICRKLNPEMDEDELDEAVEDFDECEYVMNYIESILSDYQFLTCEYGGDMMQGYYEWYVFIKDPLEDLDWLPIKMDQMRKFIEETNLELYGDTIRLTGGKYIC